ncbi:MAG: hypothetical protein AB7P20_05735 [Rhizobiaceae bacterium]
MTDKTSLFQMTTDKPSLKTFETLVASVQSMGISADDAFVRYAGRKMEGGLEIIGLQIRVGPDLPQIRTHTVETGTIVAQAFHARDVGGSLLEFVRDLFNGNLRTPDGGRKLARGTWAQGPFAYLDDNALLGNQQRWTLLRVTSVSDSSNVDEGLNWELRAHTEPYDGVSDLLAEFGLLGMKEQMHVIVPLLAGVDAESRIVGNKAHLATRLSPGLDPADFHLGYRILSRNGVDSRGSKNGSEFEWEHDKGGMFSVGRLTLDVPPACTMHCFAVYRGRAYHHWWIGDERAPHNIPRGIYQLYDDGLGKLKEAIQKGGKRSDSKTLESAVASLFWMAGFSVVHMGDQFGRDSPDVIALTPVGHVVVVECTRGGLKTDAKMQKLVDRTLELQDQLAASNASHLRVLPLMVTTRPRAEIDADLPDFERRGILVAGEEDLKDVVNRVLARVDADRVFLEFEQTAARLKDKHYPPAEEK